METSERDSERLNSPSKSGRPVRNEKTNPQYFDDTVVSGGHIRKAEWSKNNSVVSAEQESMDTDDNSELFGGNAYPSFINDEPNVQPFLDFGEGVSTDSDVPTRQNLYLFNELCKGKSNGNTKRRKPCFPYFTDSNEKQTEEKMAPPESFLRLKNFRTLSKTLKWVVYEFFYSDIDKVLFEGDYQLCLKKSFSDLHTRKMTRADWIKARSKFGKVRRCSSTFFEQERMNLAKMRDNVRMVQQGKFADLDCSSLPDQIPLMLTIGTKVSARLRKPEGIYSGTVESINTSDNSYRINFEKPKIGTRSVVDYEVFSCSSDQPEMVPTSSIFMNVPPAAYENFKFENAFFLGGSGNVSTRLRDSQFPLAGKLGGFPIQFLVLVVRLSKLLKAKREKILLLKELNAEGEKMRDSATPLNKKYQEKYARCVIELESMNKEMASYLGGMQRFYLENTADKTSEVPEDIQDECKQEARLLVSVGNSKEQDTKVVQNQNSLALITNLSSIMLQMQKQSTSVGDRKIQDLKSIKDALNNVKSSLIGTNVQLFNEKIEIPIAKILAGRYVPYTNPI